MAETTTNQIDALTNKYAEGFEKFSKSQSGNVVMDFLAFKRNLVPHTLQIVFILGVLFCWICAVLGVLGQGPVANFFTSTVKENGKEIARFNFIAALGGGVGIFVGAPFVLHYVLELIKTFGWEHLFKKIVVPIWNTVVVCFIANVLPQVLPFIYQRSMKAADIFVSKLEPFLDAEIDLIVAASMTFIALLKGCVWIPKMLCKRLAKWANGSAKDEKPAEEAK